MPPAAAKRTKKSVRAKAKPSTKKVWARGYAGDVQISIKKSKKGVNATIKLVSSKSSTKKTTTRVSTKKKPKATKQQSPTKTTSSPKNKSKRGSSAAAAAQPKQANKKSQVYVLQLEGGYVYVGKTSRGIKTRLQEHMTKGGSGFTRLHRPTGKLLCRLGNLEGDGDGPERDETLRQMYKRGPQMVRGWKYVRPGLLRRDDLEDIEANIRELFDLCRRCGKGGHFALQCRERKDRNGKGLVASFLK